MMRTKTASLALLLALPLLAATPPTAQDAGALEASVVLHRLENGWTFLILPRHDAPVVSFETYIGVGSADEPAGMSGIAHMFEHMAFKGSDRVGSSDWPAELEALTEVDELYAALQVARQSDDESAGRAAREAFAAAQARAASFVVPEEFSRLLEEAGGSSTLNASTSADETRYVVSLPKNQVELWCWLEAERFTRPVLREFYREREAVLEERRMRVDSSPFGVLLEELRMAAFRAHPYRVPTIGFPSDIAAYDRDRAQAFFDEHYGARSLTTAIVGDVDPDTLIPMLDRYFTGVPAGPETRKGLTQEPEQRGERRVDVEFPAGEMVAMAWHAPAVEHADAPAMEIAVRLLGYGRSSRLERRMVHEDAVANQVIVTTAWPGGRDANLTLILAVPNSGVETTDLEAVVYEEIARLAEEGPTSAELAGVKRVARADFLRSLRDDASVASGLTENQALTGDWRNYFRRAERLQSVRGADVQRVLKTYLARKYRTVATLAPPTERD
ncbi:MAG: insulinase family protein [Planctomycetes bacterium]|nr:insulinase family protein [Planctomycetota bacterium]